MSTSVLVRVCSLPFRDKTTRLSALTPVLVACNVDFARRLYSVEVPIRLHNGKARVQ